MDHPILRADSEISLFFKLDKFDPKVKDSGLLSSIWDFVGVGEGVCRKTQQITYKASSVI